MYSTVIHVVFVLIFHFGLAKLKFHSFVADLKTQRTLKRRLCFPHDVNDPVVDPMFQLLFISNTCINTCTCTVHVRCACRCTA